MVRYTALYVHARNANLRRLVCSLGQLIKIIRESQMELVVDKLIDFSAGKDEELRDIAGLGTYIVTSTLCERIMGV